MSVFPTAPRVVRRTGTDPEVFLVDAAGELVPAWTVMPHRSQNPRMYWDGFAAEFTTEPQGCHVNEVWEIAYGLQRLHAHAKEKGLRLTTRNTWDVPAKHFDVPEDFIQLGCEPSFNAYKLRGDIEHPPQQLRVRSAGGHVHLAANERYSLDVDKFVTTGQHSPDQLAEAVRMCDALVGVVAVSLAASFDDPARRRYYGLPGEFRLPAYGVEYRTLSNFWLIHPTLAHLTLDLSRIAAEAGLAGLRQAFGVREDDVVGVILNCDVPKARKMIQETPAYLSVLNVRYGNGQPTKLAYQMILNGLESWVKDPMDFAGNWNLNADPDSDVIGYPRRRGHTTGPVYRMVP